MTSGQSSGHSSPGGDYETPDTQLVLSPQAPPRTYKGLGAGCGVHLPYRPGVGGKSCLSDAWPPQLPQRPPPLPPPTPPPQPLRSPPAHRPGHARAPHTLTRGGGWSRAVPPGSPRRCSAWVSPPPLPAAEDETARPRGSCPFTSTALFTRLRCTPFRTTSLVRRARLSLQQAMEEGGVGKGAGVKIPCTDR